MQFACCRQRLPVWNKPYPNEKPPNDSEGTLNDEKPLKAVQAPFVGQILQPACQWASYNLGNAESAQQDGISKWQLLVWKEERQVVVKRWKGACMIAKEAHQQPGWVIVTWLIP